MPGTVTALSLAMAWGAAATLVAPFGCDDAPAPPPELLEEDRPNDAPKLDEPPPPPSTQELTEGRYKTIDLTGLPLTLQVPESWNIETLGTGSRYLLMGHAPAGQIQINLSQRPRTTQEKMDIMLDGARKEMAADPEHIKKVDLYTRGDVKIVERQVISRGELPADPNNPSAPSGPMLRWTITTYIPAGEEFDSYELNFIGLSARQFENDGPFLRKIIDSLTYNPASASVGPPAVESDDSDTDAAP